MEKNSWGYEWNRSWSWVIYTEKMNMVKISICRETESVVVIRWPWETSTRKAGKERAENQNGGLDCFES